MGMPMRVIVLNQSEPLRQIVEFITERGVDIEVVAESVTMKNLGSIVREQRPNYLFLLQQEYETLSATISELMATQPLLGVALVNEERQEVQLQVGHATAAQGMTGHELQNGNGRPARESVVIPHSPEEDSHDETREKRADAAMHTEPAATDSSDAWRTYTLSDFIYLMTEDQPTTVPSGGITDVPHEH